MDRAIEGSKKSGLARPKLDALEPEAKRQLRDYSVLTLDCYGTLVDRDRGLINALMPWLNDAGVTAGRGEILRAFSQAERAKLVTAPGVCYRDILLDVHDAVAKFFDVPNDHNAAKAFAGSIKNWPVHPDVPGALAYLKKHYRLVVLTNIDHQSFDRTSKALGVGFDAVYTAEDIGSYKPSMRSFDYLLNRLAKADIAKDRVLHVAGLLALRSCSRQTARHEHLLDPPAAWASQDEWIHHPRHRRPSGLLFPKPGRSRRCPCRRGSLLLALWWLGHLMGWPAVLAWLDGLPPGLWSLRECAPLGLRPPLVFPPEQLVFESSSCLRGDDDQSRGRRPSLGQS